MSLARQCLLMLLASSLLSACALARSEANPAVRSKAVDHSAQGQMSARDIEAITDYHNMVRRNVGVAPLVWSRTLEAFAQQWTDHLAETSCQMSHRQPNKFGENLFMGTAGYYHAVDAAKTWEDEKKLYAGGALKESNWHPAGHYTQMVWRDTRTFGCAQSLCRKTIIIACNYDPPGNYIGRKPY